MSKLLKIAAVLLCIAMAVLPILNIAPSTHPSIRVGEAVQNIAEPLATPEPPPPGSSLINVNTATLEELQQLPGIGKDKAAKIIEERETNGLFVYPADLRRVNGIGEKTLNKIRDLICFQ